MGDKDRLEKLASVALPADPAPPAPRGTFPRIPVGSGPVECVTHTRGHEHTRQ